MDYSNEEWRIVPDPRLNNLFEASNLGRVRRVDSVIPMSMKNPDGTTKNWSGKILAQRVQKTGYLLIGTSVGGKKLGLLAHRLVCMAFHGMPPEGTECAHLDGVRTNCAANNLAWVTRKENQSHRKIHGTEVKGEKYPASKLKEHQVLEILKRRKKGETLKSIAKDYGVDYTMISLICRNKKWVHVDRSQI